MFFWQQRYRMHKELKREKFWKVSWFVANFCPFLPKILPILKFVIISPILSISNFAIFLNPVITSISEIESNGDRTTEEEDSMFYMESPPTEACTFFGKHAYTNEDGFGMEYKYNLEFQGTILNVVLSYFYRFIFTCTTVADWNSAAEYVVRSNVCGYLWVMV